LKGTKTREVVQFNNCKSTIIDDAVLCQRTYFNIYSITTRKKKKQLIIEYIFVRKSLKVSFSLFIIIEIFDCSKHGFSESYVET